MEAFRRFRSRRKSKGQSDGFTSFADAESTYRPGSNAWQTSTARSSATVPRPSEVGTEKKVSHDQFRQPKSPTEYRSPGPLGRVQPMLIGISRPSITPSRPGTTESIQKALDKAAEAFTSPTQVTQTTTSPVSQRGVRAGKHVDIISLSTQTGKASTTFNEDIAARNIDQLETVDEQHYSYEPTSRYQEEVASRNAHQIASQRSSSLRGSIDVDRSKVGDGRGSAQSGSYYHHGHPGAEISRHRQSQDNAAYHSRQNSSRVRDGAEYLPAIPQERSSEDFGLIDKNNIDRVRQAEEELDKAKARWLEVRRQNRSDAPPNIDKPLPASPPQKHHPHDSGVSAVTDTSVKRREASDMSQAKARRYDSHNGAGGPDRRLTYVIIKSPDLGHIAHQDSNATQIHHSYRGTDGPTRAERLRPPSSSSNAGYKRMLVGNRTIMDLTGEDDASSETLERATSAVSYMQTPVIESAHASAYQKVLPVVVDHSPPSHDLARDPVVPNARWSSALEPVLDLDQLARRSQIIAETARARARTEALPAPVQTSSRQPTTAPLSKLAFSPIQTLTSAASPRTITFSTISTLTSTSPRSSQENLARPLGIEAPEAKAESKTQSQADGTVLSTTVKEAKSRSTARNSANIEPLVKIFADVHPEESEATRPSASSKVQAGLADSESRKGKEVKASSKKDGKRRERIAEKEAIREAAKRKIPAGPLDQEPHPGVKSRDFAMMPAEKPTNNRVEALSEKKRSQPDLKKTAPDPSSSSKSSSSEKKSRGRPAKPSHKVSFGDNPVTAPDSVSQPKEKRSEKKERKSSSSGKKSAKDSSGTRKSRRKSLFDEEAYKKKHAEANAALLRLQQSLQENFDQSPSGSEAPMPVDTSASRTVSSANTVHPVISPSAAAIAMIAAATTPPPAQARRPLHAKASSDLGQKPQKPEPVLRSNTDNSVPTVTKPSAPANPMLARIDFSSKPPPSPGEVSLSSFPIPTPRAMSPESTKSPPAYVKDVGMPVRTGSRASRMSSASTFSNQFSIPFTMVPSRIGSLPENRIGVPNPSNNARMTSIDSVIPPTSRPETAA